MPLPKLKSKSYGVNVSGAIKSKERPKHSGFLITISTNYRPTTTAEAVDMGERLEHALKKMYTHKGYGKIIKFTDPSHSYGDKYINKIDTKFAVERGTHTMGGRIHSHSIMHVTHASHIRLSIPDIKELVVAAIDHPKVKSVYVNIRMVKDGKNLEEYIKKDMVVQHKVTT